ncbi:hypothetical protein F4V43_02645 [Paenibacillus spiritus]|uniref:DUF5659 domain-containing protein n=1 Tax=Paenibacillus spiritus TaxID=2496557 RepID=A0A5J5GIS3_9BACL|nr:hypothetical protein [Paenibacillus spiritus]KAA9007404.1 hypothetical protein F4V43_02645 [Paenibacillus spiritus]
MKTYTTKDFYLTVLLMCNDFELIGSEKKKNGVHFNLNNYNDEILRNLIDQFINMEALINMSLMVKNTALLRKELDKYKN